MKKQWIWRVLGVSAVFHVLAAVFSQGFHSADEYFQILEFAAFKLGLAARADLAIEYGEQMRPWLLPGIATALVRGMQALGLSNPHHWAVVLRLVSGAIGWSASVAVAFAAPAVVRSLSMQRLAVLAAAFLWFVPALHVRPSSEAWSGAWLAIAWSVVVLELARKPAHKTLALRGWIGLLAGAAAGLSFESRFQAGVMIAPFAVLLAVRLWQRGGRARREGLAFFGALSLGFCAVFALGRVIDAWGYGVWCFSPWNYVHFNLVRDEVNKFGVSPFWDVFRMANTEAWPVLGFLLVVSWCVAWVRQPLSLLTAVSAPLFLVHCAIAHKELRFFFPLTYFAPLLLAVACEGWEAWFFRKRVWRILLGIIVAWNGLGFLVSSFVPISRNVLFFRVIWDRGLTEIGTWDHDPFEVLGTRTAFYRPQQWRAQSIRTPEELWQWTASPRPIFRAGADLPEWVSGVKNVACEREYIALPEALLALRQAGYLPRANAWTLWSCHRVD